MRRCRTRPWWLSIAVCAGCSALTTMYGPSRVPVAQRVAGTTLFDWKGVVHCHSHLSHDSTGTVAEISAACREAGIDFLVMTDHQTDAAVREGARGRIGETLFLVGAEIRTPQGTILAFPLTAPLRRWQSAGALVAEARRRDAIAFLGHAENTTAWDVEGLAGVEVVNLHAGALATHGAGLFLAGLLLPLRVVLQLVCHRDAALFAEWDRQLARRHPFTPVGGNDAHANVRVFGPLGGTVGDYREVFLTLSTHVLAEDLDEGSLVEALRAGRTYVSFDIFGEGAGFDFRGVDGAGVHLMGSTVRASPSLRLMVRAPTVGRIRLLRDGVVVRESEGDTMDVAGPEAGVYRVEVRTTGGALWLFSSSIRVVVA